MKKEYELRLTFALVIALSSACSASAGLALGAWTHEAGAENAGFAAAWENPNGSGATNSTLFEDVSNGTSAWSQLVGSNSGGIFHSFDLHRSGAYDYAHAYAQQRYSFTVDTPTTFTIAGLLSGQQVGGTASLEWSLVGGSVAESHLYVTPESEHIVDLTTSFSVPLEAGTYEFFSRASLDYLFTDNPNVPRGDAAASGSMNLSLSIVPAPGAALLGALGLSLIGWVKRRLS